MPIMHHEMDRLLPIRFTRLLGNQLMLILFGSIPGCTLAKMASAPESETMQSERNGTVMLALTSIRSTPFMAAWTPESMRLEPLVELLLLAFLGNLCPMGIMNMPVGVARLAPSGVASTPFGTAGVL